MGQIWYSFWKTKLITEYQIKAWVRSWLSVTKIVARLQDEAEVMQVTVGSFHGKWHLRRALWFRFYLTVRKEQTFIRAASIIGLTSLWYIMDLFTGRPVRHIDSWLSVCKETRFDVRYSVTILSIIL